MNVQEILNNVKKLDDESKILVIDGIQKMLIDDWDDLSDEEKASIEAGLKDAEEGNMVDHEEVRKRYEKHL